MNANTSKRHLRRMERLRRETAARQGYLLLWATLAGFLLLCLFFVLR